MDHINTLSYSPGLLVEYLCTELRETGKLDKLLITGMHMLARWCSSNLYKLSVESKDADTIGQCFETKSRNELNFDIIKSLFGIIVAEVGENNTSLSSEHKEGMLIIGIGMVGVI